jgi:hypothetical protein
VLGSQTQVPDAVPLVIVPVPSICQRVSPDVASIASANWMLNVDAFGTGFVGTPMIKFSGSASVVDDVMF